MAKTITIAVCVTVLLCVGSVVSCTAYESDLITQSPDPIAAKCATAIEMSRNPVCMAKVLGR